LRQSNMDEQTRSHYWLIFWLCLLVYINVSIFTIITSFTKGNFLTAIQSHTSFHYLFDHKPYFFLYGFSGICFIFYYLLSQFTVAKISFERRVKYELLSFMFLSLVLLILPALYTGFYQKFFPAAVYFVIFDIFDELIILQTWSLINFCINIRESKRIQNLFLFSGGVAAFIAGRFIIRLVPQDLQMLFLLMVIVLSGASYLIVRHIFSKQRGRIMTAVSAEKVGLKTLLSSQKKYQIIKSIIYITILIGIFNLFFKVLFDMEVNRRFPIQEPQSGISITQNHQDLRTERPMDLSKPDPKTRFIGQYKAYIYLAQVLLQLSFLYFFARLWFSGRILYAYPLLLIPNLIFILLISFSRFSGSTEMAFWGTITACGMNELLRRVIFDSSYQLLIFAIPERLCNALRFYTRMFIKPVFIIGICSIFIIIPVAERPIVKYLILLVLGLIILALAIHRIPRRYASSLKESVVRRMNIQAALDSISTLETKFIREQYERIVSRTGDIFGYLYLLNILDKNYAPELNDILLELLRHADREIRLKTLSVIRDHNIREFKPDLEEAVCGEKDMRVVEAVLEILCQWGPIHDEIKKSHSTSSDPAPLLKYSLAAAHRYGTEQQKRQVEKEMSELALSKDPSRALTGIWLVGELHLPRYGHLIEHGFSMDPEDAFEIVVEAFTKIKDLDRLNAYLVHIGYERIPDFKVLNRNLALFGPMSFDTITDMIIHMVKSRDILRLERCLRAFRFSPNQESVDYLIDILMQFQLPLIRREAFRCVAMIKRSNSELNFENFFYWFPHEIDQLRRMLNDYRAVAVWNPDSLLLKELARGIETQVWILFSNMDMFYSDLAIMDSYYRITHAPTYYVKAFHTKAKTIEYLDTLIKKEHADLIELLEIMAFEDGYLTHVGQLRGEESAIEQVYENIMKDGYYWLKLVAVMDMPKPVARRHAPFIMETEAMIPTLEKTQFLKNVPLFRGFSTMDLLIVAQIAKQLSFHAGHTLFQYNDPGDALYILLEGQVEIRNAEGLRIGLIKPPQSFGEVALLDKSGRAATATCTDDCRMLMISSDDFQDILEDYPDLYKNIILILTKWLRETETR